MLAHEFEALLHSSFNALSVERNVSAYASQLESKTSGRQKLLHVGTLAVMEMLQSFSSDTWDEVQDLFAKGAETAGELTTGKHQVWFMYWCCFYYFVRNSLTALLEDLCARILFFRLMMIVDIVFSWYIFSLFSPSFVCVQGLCLQQTPFFRPFQPGSCVWLSPFLSSEKYG